MTIFYNGAAKARCVWVACASVAAVTLWAAPSARAADMIHMHDWIADLVQTSKIIKRGEAGISQAKERTDAASGGWFPTLDATASYGYEDRQAAESASDTVLHPRTLKLTMTQKLWDFGDTDARIEQARARTDAAKADATGERQGVVFAGVEAYLNLIRQHTLLRFARASIENLKRQLELEDARVERGSGLSTDVLQAKRALAGAEARRTRAEGDLKQATSYFLRIYGALPPDIDMMMEPAPPVDLLPPTMESAVDSALRANPNLARTAADMQLAQAAVDRSRADGFFPKLNLITEYDTKTGDAGTAGNVATTSVKVEMKYSWNLAATAIDSLEAEKHGSVAAALSHADTLDQIEQAVRSAWDLYETARENAEFLNNEANISAEFLNKARRERTLGNRSLLDLISAETDLQNATSGAASARIDASIAVFRLLAVMGQLDLDSIPKSDRSAALGN